MGLPGAGKTVLAKQLTKQLISTGASVSHINADQVRKDSADWDFSHEGRLRQSHRIRLAADLAESAIVIADFVAPLVAQREIFSSHYLVWVDTVLTSKYGDTNACFQPPMAADCVVYTKHAVYWSKIITQDILIRLRTKNITCD